MEKLADILHLGPDEEAKRLWSGAMASYSRAQHDLVSMCESLDLGIRAAEILAIRLLEPNKDRFPATISLLLDTPVAEVDEHRDAVIMPKVLHFTEILDLFSAPDLECVGPGLHRGWEDRRFSCRRSRAVVQESIGITLNEQERSQLLLLSAYRNRIFRLPPPVRIVTKDILSAYQSLIDLVNNLFGALEG